MRQCKYTLNGELLPLTEIADRLGFYGAGAFIYRSHAERIDIQQVIDEEIAYQREHGERSDRRHQNGCPRRRILYDGEMITFSELSRRTGVHRTTIIDRYARGIRMPELIRQMRHGVKTVTLYGREMPIRIAAQKLFISRQGLVYRARANGTTMQEEFEREWARQHGTEVNA